jgi:hypothetical protein
VSALFARATGRRLARAEISFSRTQYPSNRVCTPDIVDNRHDTVRNNPVEREHDSKAINGDFRIAVLATADIEQFVQASIVVAAVAAAAVVVAVAGGVAAGFVVVAAEFAVE